MKMRYRQKDVSTKDTFIKERGNKNGIKIQRRTV